MASTIKLTPDELRSSAKAYSEGHETIDELLQKLSSTQETIRSNWEGNAFEKFDDQFNDLKPKVQQFSDLLDDIYNQLQKVAEIIENTDNDIASQIAQ